MGMMRWTAPSPDTPRHVTIVGSTGSVGQSTADLIARAPDSYRVEALVAGNSVEALAEQARRLKAKMAVVANPQRYRALKDALVGTSIEAAAGPEAVIEAASRPAEWVMAAVVGYAGLAPTLVAARRGAMVALANKEALVCAGRLLIDAIAGSGGVLLPVDSEHNAIFQVFDPNQRTSIDRLILTASGGPFRNWSLADMAEAAATARIEPLTGGVGVNEVWSVRINGQLAVGRLGKRSDADLSWETELLRHLDREGMTVPVPIPTTDGRHFAGGLVVMSYVEGGSPETEADWRRVADTLRQLHRLTQGWPQRQGWRSSTDLLHTEAGTKIDLGTMPPEGVVRCRAAWARLTGRERCVVHGDPNAGNIRMTADRVALIDWDESHVDVPDLDLVLPHNAAGLADDMHDVAAQARAAWEAAVCWDPSGTDEFAVKRLAEVRAV